MVSRALFVTGTVGAGKSTVLDHLGDLLSERGTSFLLVDLDLLHRAWPPPPEDPANEALELANLSALVRNVADRDPELVVVVGVLRTLQAREACAAALGVVPWVVRLDVDPAQVREQLHGRYPDPDRAHHLQWHLDHAASIDAAVRAEGVADAVVSTVGLTRRQVAEQVLASMGPAASAQ